MTFLLVRYPDETGGHGTAATLCPFARDGIRIHDMTMVSERYSIINNRAETVAHPTDTGNPSRHDATAFPEMSPDGDSAPPDRAASAAQPATNSRKMRHTGFPGRYHRYSRTCRTSLFQAHGPPDVSCCMQAISNIVKMKR